jgi:hypothetical protein
MNFKKQLLIVMLICVIFGIVSYFVLPDPVDWHDSYYPAALKMLSGHSPFEISTFYNAPWILIPFIPLILLPERMGGAVFFSINLFLIYCIGKKFKVHPVILALSFPACFLLLYGQVDGLVLAGLLLPQWLGVLLLIAKPQIGVWVIIYYFYMHLRTRQWKKLFFLFASLVACYALSYLLYGPWMSQNNLFAAISYPHNSSLWPVSIMFGLPLLVAGLREQNIRYVMMATPLLSPYVGPHSWLIFLVAIPWFDFFVLTTLSSWSFLIIWWRPLGEVLLK